MREQASKHVKPIRNYLPFRCGDRFVHEYYRMDFPEMEDYYKESYMNKVSIRLGEKDHKHIFPETPGVTDGVAGFVCIAKTKGV